jgi:soluble lytic murein transglycosylase-like protein
MVSVSDHMLAVQRRIAGIEARLERLNRLSETAVGGQDFQSMIAGRGSAASTPEDLRPIIDEAAAKYGIRPELLEALIQQESGFRIDAVSSKGAQGLTQLMPATAAGLGVTDPFDPRQNIMGGARYLRAQLDRFDDDESQALAAYNAGPGAVLRHNGVPPYPETRNYVSSVLSLAGEAE